MPSNNVANLGLVLALFIGAAACGDSGDEAAVIPGEYSADLLDLDASVVGGGTYSLDDHTSSDLVLWFWAPW